MSSTCTSWNSLPQEMKLAVVDVLEEEDVFSLSGVDMGTYQACIPSIFKKVKLNDYEALEAFMENVPRSYCTYIQELDLCTQHRARTTPVLPRVRADTVISLLLATPCLKKLDLRVDGSMDKSIISPFPYLDELKHLSIKNCGDETRAPLSERLVVSVALSLRNLEELSLDRITRSKIHASELDGIYPCVPLACNDEDIPDHAIVGSELCLPSLLRIPTLRKLTIRDTHLGHEGWTNSPVNCRLEFLDIGSCYHEDEGFNTRCTERIMATVGETVDEFSLTAAVSDSVFAEPSATPLQRLRKLHITPFFPIDSVVDTMTNLAGSPVEKISVQCFEEDVVDMCTALEDFLALRIERGPEFYDKLKQINVTVTAATDDGAPATEEETEERLAAATRLQDFCRDLRLRSVVDKAEKKKIDKFLTPISFTDAKRYPVKGRAMTL